MSAGGSLLRTLGTPAYEDLKTSAAASAKTTTILDRCHIFQVQVRQKTRQRKTLFYLEQLLIKYGATKDCTGIKIENGDCLRPHG